LDKLVHNFRLTVRLSVLGDGRLQDDPGEFCKLPGELCYKLGTTIGCDYFGDSMNPPDMHKIQICQFSGRAGFSGREAEKPFAQAIYHHQNGVVVVLVRGK
jgi:hypothetical protein